MPLDERRCGIRGLWLYNAAGGRGAGFGRTAPICELLLATPIFFLVRTARLILLLDI